MTDEEYTSYLRTLGAREYEVVALQMDQKRGLAAIALAVERNADRPVPYALKMFDDPSWEPEKAKPVLKTNQSVEVVCPDCGGDRFVLVTDGPEFYGETYAPCARCNADTNTTRWLVTGERLTTAPR